MAGTSPAMTAASGPGDLPRLRSAAPGARSWGFDVLPYHSRARIQSFQAFAAPFPGEPALPALPRRGAGDRNAAVQETEGRLLPPGLREVRQASTHRLQAAAAGTASACTRPPR